MKIVRIGRNQANDRVIGDPLVSRSHCQIIQDEYGGFTIIDSSTNGTFVNGERIGKNSKIPLHKNDIVRIGNSTLPWLSYFSQGTIGSEIGTNIGGGYPGNNINVNVGGNVENYVRNEPPQARPNNFLVWAILSTIFCCTPLGIVSVVNASKVDCLWEGGNYSGAIEAARKARTWFWLTFGISLLVYITIIVLQLTIGILGGMLL